MQTATQRLCLVGPAACCRRGTSGLGRSFCEGARRLHGSLAAAHHPGWGARRGCCGARRRRPRWCCWRWRRRRCRRAATRAARSRCWRACAPGATPTSATPGACACFGTRVVLRSGLARGCCRQYGACWLLHAARVHQRQPLRACAQLQNGRASFGVDSLTSWRAPLWSCL